jgi:hypothetical protein
MRLGITINAVSIKNAAHAAVNPSINIVATNNILSGPTLAISANVRLLVAIAIQLSQLGEVAGYISKRLLAHTINTKTGIPINAVLKKKCW